MGASWKLSVAALAFVVGCGAARPPVSYTIPERRWIEAEPLPADVATEPLPGPVHGLESDVAPYEPGLVPGDEGYVDWTGLVVSEARARRDALYRIRYRELRAFYEADRRVWVAHREAYETRLQLAADRILSLEPSWWDQHDGEILGILGAVLGAAAVIGIAAALDAAIGGP